MTHDEWVKMAIEMRNLQIDDLTAKLKEAEAEVERLKGELRQAIKSGAWLQGELRLLMQTRN